MHYTHMWGPVAVLTPASAFTFSSVELIGTSRTSVPNPILSDQLSPFSEVWYVSKITIYVLSKYHNGIYTRTYKCLSSLFCKEHVPHDIGTASQGLFEGPWLLILINSLNGAYRRSRSVTRFSRSSYSGHIIIFTSRHRYPAAHMSVKFFKITQQKFWLHPCIPENYE